MRRQRMQSLWTISLPVAIALSVLAAIPAGATTYNFVFGAPYAAASGITPSTAQQYTGAGSWYEEYPSGKTEVYVDPAAQFGASFTIDDIANINYHTVNDAANPSGVDFYLLVYTPLEGVDDDGTWYNKRLAAEPYLANGYTAPTAWVWNTWTTDSPTNQLTFFDANNCGNWGFYGAPTLADLQAGAINWSTWVGNPTQGTSDPNPIDYGAKSVMLLCWSTGSGWSAFSGYLDAIEINLTNGDSYVIDLESTTDPVYVDDDWAGSVPGTEVEAGKYFGYNAFATVQEGVDNVSASTVYVAPGTYEEQVEISSDLNLIGSGIGVTTIQSPPTLPLYYMSSDTNRPIIHIHDAAAVHVEALTVDGLGRGNVNRRFIGIGYWNAGGSMVDCEIVGLRNTPFNGSQWGVGIYAYANAAPARTLDVTGCLIHDFQKNATAFLGSYLTATVDDCDLVGVGATGVIAQNGVQIGSGAQGSATGNRISGISYTGSGWAASGMLLAYPGGPITSTGNEIDECLVGVYILGGSHDVTGNTLTATPAGTGAAYIWGVIVDPGASNGRIPRISGVDADPAGVSGTTKVEVSPRALGADLVTTTLYRNNIDNGGLGAGIGVYAFSGEVIDVSIIENIVTGCEVGVELYDDGASTITAVVTDNSLAGNTYGYYNWTLDPQDARFNYWGDYTGPVVATTNTTAIGAELGTDVPDDVQYVPWYCLPDGDAGTAGYQPPSPMTWGINTIESMQDVYLTYTTGGDAIFMRPGVYPEGNQVAITKDISVIGEARTGTVIVPTANTGSSGDARGWFLVNPGYVLNLSTLTLDGTGYNIYQAVRTLGTGTIDQCNIRNVTYSTYLGLAIAAFDNITVSNCDFENIGRVGTIFFGTGVTAGVFEGNTYAGKGDGDWLDYAVEMGGGAVADITGNTITGCTGVASSDGSTSAGILMTTYYGAGTAAELDGNRISGCTTGLALGYDASDNSTALITNNEFVGNGEGIYTTASPSISITAYGNYFGNTVNAVDNTAGGTWDDGASIGNCWSDFSSNSGFPTQYNVGGSAGAVDYYPNDECGLYFDPPAIVYHCSGTLDFGVHIGSDVQDLEGAHMVMTYPADLAFSSVTAGSANLIAFHSLTDNPTGTDTLTVDVGVLSGAMNGPGLLFTVSLTGASSLCGGNQISMAEAELRDGNNLPIVASLATPADLTTDCNDPVFVLSDPASGGYFNVPPVLNFGATDDCGLDAVHYQIDGCAPGNWIAIATGITGTSYSDAAWTLPGFASLTEGVHCVNFRVLDETGRGNADSCSSWCFTKDVTAPPPPTGLTAAPGHNKVHLAWTNAASDFDHTVIMRAAWHAGGSGYPEYDDEFAEGPYPADTLSGDHVYAGSGIALTDTYNLSNATRDVYHFAAFTVDAAGNVSVPSNGARATSYWLGDLAVPYDGSVYFSDLAVFSTTFSRSHGQPGYNSEADFGPTYDMSPKGIPTTDNLVNFEDLVIFAINFDAVSPLLKSVPIFAESSPDITGALTLALRMPEDAPAVNETFTVQIEMRNNADQVKALRFALPYDRSQLELISVDRSEALAASSWPVFFHAVDTEGRVEVDLALLGGATAFGGSGDVVNLTFRLKSIGMTSLAFDEVELRDGENNPLTASTEGAFLSTGTSVPKAYYLAQNYPNPYNASTNIGFQVPQPGHVTICVYNVTGQLVSTLVDEHREAGSYTVTWNGKAADGGGLATGVYFYRMNAGSYTATRKMVLVK